MRVCALIILAIALGSSAQAYENLSDAFRCHTDSDQWYSDLPESAVQYVIDYCGLDWVTGWPKAPSRGWSTVRASVSQNRSYCLLTRAGAERWEAGGSADYCLVDSRSGRLWLKEGGIAGAPLVSNDGIVALLEPGWPREGTPFLPIRLLLVDVHGDTVYSHEWRDHIRRPLQRSFLAESYMFSPDGRYFLLTINRCDPEAKVPQGLSGVRFLDGYNNTWLYRINARAGGESAEYLGSFSPAGVRMSGQIAILTGIWAAGLPILGAPEGYYRVNCSIWTVRKVVTKGDRR